MYNGTNVPCFGEKEGSITSAVSGGVPPYSYQWTTGATTPNISALAAGYYSLTVKDATGEEKKADITLTEPEPLTVFADPLVYPNGKNISCFECFNGSIDLQVQKGTPPYSYVWQDASITTQDRTGLGAKSYEVTVTDANGCVEKAAIALEQPESNDWKRGGNTGTDPAIDHIGTNDAKDVVFKANGQESVRLKANGSISLLGNLTQTGPITRTSSGELRIGDPDDWPTAPEAPCTYLRERRYWRTQGNDFTGLCPDELPMLGTLNAHPLKFITSGSERMRIAPNGSVVIGSTTVPGTKLHVQGDVSIANGTNGDLITSSSAETGPVLWARNNVAAWGLSIDPSGKGHILGDWNSPQPTMTFTYDGVEIPTRLVLGTMPTDELHRLFVQQGIRTESIQADQIIIGDVPTPSGYKLYVKHGILTEKVKIAIATESQWMDHVFGADYDLPSLEEVQRFICMHGHLQGVPSATEVVEQGLDVAAIEAVLLGKVEELTLYVIQLHERIKELEKKIGED